MVYRTPSHQHYGPAAYPPFNDGLVRVEDVMKVPGHKAPVAQIRVIGEGPLSGKKYLTIAGEGMRVGTELRILEQTEDKKRASPRPGEITTLECLREGDVVFNVESRPGDGGKLGRSAGSWALIEGMGAYITLVMPSGKKRKFLPTCRATVGYAAGGGQKELPFAKAGKKHHAYHGKSKAWPRVRGVAMNPINHPHGGGNHHRVGKPSTVSKNAPPGRRVGRMHAKPRNDKQRGKE